MSRREKISPKNTLKNSKVGQVIKKLFFGNSTKDLPEVSNAIGKYQNIKLNDNVVQETSNDELSGIKYTPPQDLPRQGLPSEGLPFEGLPPQDISPDGLPSQGVPAEILPSQGLPPQGQRPTVPPRSKPSSKLSSGKVQKRQSQSIRKVSQNTKNRLTMPQVHETLSKTTNEDQQNQKLDEGGATAIEMSIENQDDQLTEVRRVSSRIENSDTFAENSTNGAKDLNTSVQKEEKQEPQEEPQKEPPKKDEETDELAKKLKNLRFGGSQTDNQSNMPKKRASTEESPKPKRHSGEGNKLGKDQDPSLISIIKPSALDQSEDKVEIVPTSKPPENQQGDSYHGTESLTDDHEPGQFAPFSFNQNDSELETSQQIKTAELSPSSTNHDPGIQSQATQQTAEPCPFSSDQDQKNLEIRLKSIQDYHDKNEDKIKVSEGNHAVEVNVPEVTELQGHPDQVNACKSTVEPINQGQDPQGEKQNLDKGNLSNISSKQNLEVSPESTNEEALKTATTPSNQENNVQDVNDEFVQNALKNIKSIVREVEELEQEMEAFLGTLPDHPDFSYMDELMTRNLIKLDNIATRNNQEVRQERKKGIQFIQRMLKKLDAKLKENQKKGNETVKVVEEKKYGTDDNPVNDNVGKQTENLDKVEKSIEETQLQQKKPISGVH